MNTKRKIKNHKRKNFQTKKNKINKNLSKRSKTNKKNILQKASKSERLMKARNLFASVGEHHL
jgi:hypothetical protein